MRLIDANGLLESIRKRLGIKDLGWLLQAEKVIVDEIQKAPTVNAEPQWIPCSERLPAYGEDVLISIGGYCNVGHVVPVNEEERYNWYFSGWYHSPNDVVAWMPLPEPYAGDN